MHRGYDTPCVASFRALIITAGLLLSPSWALASQLSVAPPSIEWRRGVGVLQVSVRPGANTHLAPQVPVRCLLDDQGGHVVRWSASSAAGRSRTQVKLPLPPRSHQSVWTLEVRGAVCNDDESICAPFVAAGPIAGGVAFGSLLIEDQQPTVGLERDPVEEALGKHKLVLVDFSAIWCPPCDRLRDEFLQSPRWADLLDSFELVVLDADDPSSFQAKDRYRVGGYPTLLVLSQEGQVLDRMVGFDGASRTAARLRRVLVAARSDEAGDPLRIARRLAASGDGEGAWHQVQVALDLVPGASVDQVAVSELAKADYELLALGVDLSRQRTRGLSILLARAAAETAPRPGLAAGHADVAVQLLEELGRVDEATSLRAEYGQRIQAAVGARSPLDVTVAPDRGSLVGEVLLHPQEVQTDYAQAAWYLAQWSGGDQRKALLGEAALRLAASLFSVRSVPRGEGLSAANRVLSLPEDLLQPDLRSRLHDAEGTVHDLLTVLAKADLPEVAEPIGDTMVELFPTSFSWHFRRAGFRLDQRDGEDAVPPARLALKYSYGDNRLRASLRLARALLVADLAAEAVVVVEAALGQPVPQQEQVRTHRYRLQLSELLVTARTSAVLGGGAGSETGSTQGDAH
ncbi:MAG TPA: hypothetical protein DIU15_10315 [Deltaproteobacteria bacterium]|nr:hypothetical protein [Deltaproteobacteria bacterium]HCP46428.1 hypothetical protein [Deltaproteobacteria bacterium]